MDIATSTRRPRRRQHVRSLWSLAVMGLLRERDMHPYEMQRQMHMRHTDELLGLKRGSLYHAINQLQRDGLIESIETSREGRWPERTVYPLTPDGEEELLLWLRSIIDDLKSGKLSWTIENTKTDMNIIEQEEGI